MFSYVVTTPPVVVRALLAQSLLRLPYTFIYMPWGCLLLPGTRQRIGGKGVVYSLGTETYLTDPPHSFMFLQIRIQGISIDETRS